MSEKTMPYERKGEQSNSNRTTQVSSDKKADRPTGNSNQDIEGQISKVFKKNVKKLKLDVIFLAYCKGRYAK